MMLNDLLAKKKKDILQRWFSLVLKTYPDDAARFMRDESNRFANPVGQTFLCEFEAIYDALIIPQTEANLNQALQNSIKIRAVQDFSASQAVSFIFLLKTAVRQSLQQQLGDIYENLLEFESRIDRLALEVFDRYMAEREKLYSIRLNESRRSVARCMERYRADITIEQPNKSRGSQDVEK